MRFRHRVARGLQLLRNRDVDIFTAVSSLNAYAAIPDMLWTKANDLAFARSRLKRELHHQPLLRSEWPNVATLLDLVIGPSVVPLNFGDFDAGNAFGRINFEHGGYGLAEQTPDRLEPVAFHRLVW